MMPRCAAVLSVGIHEGEKTRRADDPHTHTPSFVPRASGPRKSPQNQYVFGAAGWCRHSGPPSYSPYGPVTKESFMTDFARDVAYMLRQRRIQVQDLQSFTGRTNHIANLLYAWRPFIGDLWGGGIHERKRAGDSRVWGKANISNLSVAVYFLIKAARVAENVMAL